MAVASPGDGCRTLNANDMRHRRAVYLTDGNNANTPPIPTGIFVPQRDHSATLATEWDKDANPIEILRRLGKKSP